MLASRAPAQGLGTRDPGRVTMPGTSTKTVVFMVRLPVDVARLVESNAAKLGKKMVSEYLRRIIVRQVSRKR